MLCAADSVGVFQVESRAQMATLPRLKPRTFYDLVVEVALIRPGPIQGGSVHPYIRRRNGQEPVTYLHPLLEPLAGARRSACRCSRSSSCRWPSTWPGSRPAEADQLRQAMGSKRSRERMERLAPAALRRHGRAGHHAGRWPTRSSTKMAAFANFGFPESHSVSFAYLVYASAWIKLHDPAAFCAALLNAQPMGFYSPHVAGAGRPPPRRGGAHPRPQRLRLARPTSNRAEGSEGGVAVRLGLSSVRALGDDLAEEVAAGRPYADLEDLVRRGPRCRWPTSRRWPPRGRSAASGSTAGRRLWAVGAVAQSRPGRLAGHRHRRRRADRCRA